MKSSNNLYIILLLLLFQHFCVIVYCETYDVAYSINQQQYYGINDDYYFELHGSLTLEVVRSCRVSQGINRYGFPTYYTHNISDIKYLNSRYKLKESYPILLPVGSPTAPKKEDQLTDVNMKSLNYIFYGDNSILYDINEIPYEPLGLTRLKNAAMVPVNDGYLCIFPYVLFWLDKDFKLDLSNTQKPTNESINYIPTRIGEEDHRFLLLPNGDILVVYTAILDTTQSNVNKAAIRIIKKKSQYEYVASNEIILYKDDIMKNLKSGFEKNWTPFNYRNNQTFFIQSFQPFVVYKLDRPNRDNTKYLQYTFSGNKYPPIKYTAQSVSLISSIDCPNIITHFGKVRGGTQATLVRGQYLSFYHVTEPGHDFHFLEDLLPNNRFFYFMGAFTFSRDPPFKITSMSRYPISHKTFVPGIYKAGHPPGLITFPVSYVLVDKYNNLILEGEPEIEASTTTVVLTIGVRDTHTITAKINLNKLYSTFKTITC